MGSAAARRQHDMAELHLHELRLIEHLAGRFHIARAPIAFDPPTGMQ